MPPRRTPTGAVAACGVERHAATAQRSAALRARVRGAVGARAVSLRRAPAALASGVARRPPGAGHNRAATAAVPLIGARYERDGAADVTHFRVRAQDHADVALEVHGPDGTVERRPMHAEGDGFYSVSRRGVGPGARYKYRLGATGSFPDLASRSRPDGVDAASEVVDTLESRGGR